MGTEKAVKNSIRFTVVIFVLSLGLLVHDSIGVNGKLSPEDVQSIQSTRPPLIDVLGQPIKVATEEEYEKALSSGKYTVKPGSTLPVISPEGRIASIDATDVAVAFVKGWRLETFEHQADRILEQKQMDAMWLADWPGLFLHVVLCQFSAILLLGSFFLVRSISEQSFFSFIGPFAVQQKE